MILKVILLIFGIFILILFILPLVTTRLNTGNIVGILLGTAITLCGVFYNRVYNTVCTLWQTTIGSVFISFILVMILSIAVLFAATLIAVIHASKPNASGEKTIILLGCRVKGDEPSTALRVRTMAAAEYLKSNPDSVAILSGGQGAGENISEAECTYRILLNEGISANRLFKEDKSTSTDENIRFSKKIIDDNNLSDKIAITTSEYHQLRAKMIAKKHGFAQVKSIPSSTVKFTRPPVYFREVIGIWYLIVKNRLG